MRLTRREKVLTLTCLEKIWDCYFDKPYFGGLGETLRLKVIEKIKKDLEKPT